MVDSQQDLCLPLLGRHRGPFQGYRAQGWPDEKRGTTGAAQGALSSVATPDRVIGTGTRDAHRRRSSSRWWAHWRLVRPLDALPAIAATVIGARLAGDGELATPAIVGMTVSNALLFAASMAFNDWRDVVEDSINKPDRPIPSGEIRRGAALVIAALLFLLAILVAALVRPVLGVSAAALSLISLAYTLRLKGMPLIGNVTVALLCTYPLLCWMPLAARVSRTYLVLCAACWLLRTGAEIVKTAEDFRGDRVSGIDTLATTRGVAVANRAGSSLLCAAVLLSWCPVLWGATNPFYSWMLGGSTALAGSTWCAALLTAGDGEYLGRPLVLTERAITVIGCFAFGFGMR